MGRGSVTERGDKASGKEGGAYHPSAVFPGKNPDGGGKRGGDFSGTGEPSGEKRTESDATVFRKLGTTGET